MLILLLVVLVVVVLLLLLLMLGSVFKLPLFPYIGEGNENKILEDFFYFVLRIFSSVYYDYNYYNSYF